MTLNRRCSVHASFAHRSKPLLYFMHGDDYVGLGVRGDLEGYRAKLSERFINKDRGTSGSDGLQEIRFLNTVITYHPAKPGCPEMLTHEADQRHADLLMAAYVSHCVEQDQGHSLGQGGFPGSTSAGGPFLDEKRRVAFRSNCMRCLYLALSLA